MRFETLSLPGPVLIHPKKIADSRGSFMEAFKATWFRDEIADVEFIQDNQSLSVQKGTIRGLHYQMPPFGQGKLVRCLRGAIFDVAVDIRPQSPHFGQWAGAELSAENAAQLWVPEGFAHGFCTLTADCEVFYKVTAPYSHPHDRGIAFDDPDVAIDWPVDPAAAILSDKDKAQPPLRSLKS